MKLGERFRGFLLLQNMMLKDFIRHGLATRSLATEDAARLNRVATLNVLEIARWDRDLSNGGGSKPSCQDHAE
ncbi:hypothetical protein WSK_4155 [Novosphingobium sp. Rr 2-17]|uniref:hypothetical protein n=1 Tax=Novosphingobium sp. Rr 2-17 TaxID=555793 RepID=UPI000269A275|nr:hypothetical protein [Novosphingobium sp. Rr 2-17]EIZ77287.1 hypothetical protein WSK_4155 [Novosphingobium sp. Rr 2-17]